MREMRKMREKRKMREMRERREMCERSTHTGGFLSEPRRPVMFFSA